MHALLLVVEVVAVTPPNPDTSLLTAWMRRKGQEKDRTVYKAHMSMKYLCIFFSVLITNPIMCTFVPGYVIIQSLNHVTPPLPFANQEKVKKFEGLEDLRNENEGAMIF